MNEVKHQRFRRVASNRMNKLLDQIRLLGNCSNKINYAYTAEEVQYMFDTISNLLQVTRDRFENQSKIVSSTFSFDELTNKTDR